MATDRSSALRNADLAGVPDADSERDDAVDGPGTPQSATEADHAPSGLLRRLASYWTPPSLWTDQPAAMADLRHYADRAPWTSQRGGFVRGSGKAYWLVVGRSATVTLRYREWIWQRPGRLLTAAVLLSLFGHTTPGQWLGWLLSHVGHGVMWLFF